MKSLLRSLTLGLILLVPFTPALAQTPTVSAKVTLQGPFKSDKDRTCFRIRSENSSFNPRNVDLASILLEFSGQSITALAGSTHLQFDCDEEGEGDGVGECDSCGHDDAARILADGPGDLGDGEDDDDDCEECDNECDSCNTSNCDTVGVRACFSTQDILTLFGDATLPARFADADVRFTLSDGTVVVATIGGSGLTRHDNAHGKDKMHVRARPNPLNPRTELSFVLSQGGRVQVSVYDMQGRLVNKLLDNVLPAGQQRLVWDGSSNRNSRVSSGVYFFRIQAPEGQVIQRVAVVK